MGRNKPGESANVALQDKVLEQRIIGNSLTQQTALKQCGQQALEAGQEVRTLPGYKKQNNCPRAGQG